MIFLRRIGVGLLLLAGLGIMGLAASTFAQAQDKKDNGDGKKPSLQFVSPAAFAQAQEKKDRGGNGKKNAGRMLVDWNEKKYTTEMDGKKWEDVFSWLADQSDLPFVYGKYKAPAGTIKITVPKNRKFSLLELYDIINERLQAHETFTLLRSDVSLSLVPADEDIPPALIPRIKVEELPERGRTEIVEVMVKLKGSLNAEEFGVSMKRLLGKFARVTPIPDTNSLIMSADVATLMRHIPSIVPPVDEKTGKVIEDTEHTWPHKCEYIRAATAEAVLTKALGQSRQIIEVKSATPKDQTAGDTDKRPPGGGQTSRKVREHTISVDRASNTVIISGPTDKIAQAKAILAKIDAPGQKGAKKMLPTYPSELKYHDLAAGNSDAVAKLLSDIYKADDSVRISPSGPARLMVWADPQTHFEINKLTSEGQQSAELETVSISLTRLEAGKFAESLKKMIPSSDKGSPFIEADTDQNSIRVRGTPGEIKEIRGIIRALDDSSAANGGGGGGYVRYIHLDKGSGATLAQAIQMIFGELRPDVDVKRVSTQGEDYKFDFKEPEKKPEVKPIEKKSSRLTPDKMREAIRQSGREVPVIFDSQEGKKQEKKDPLKKKPTLMITGFGNKIIITGDDKETLDLAQQLIRMLVNTEAGPGDFQVIRLKWANAIEVAKILDEAFNGPKTQGGGGRGGGFPFGGGGFPFGGGGGQPARTEILRVVADTATNSLLVRAKPVDMLTIRRLLAQQLDVQNLDSENIAKTFIIGPLKNATAANVSEVLERVYRDSMSRTSNTISQNTPGFNFFQRQTTSDPIGQNALLSISPDNTTNTVIVQCSTKLHKDIKKLVDDLDEVAGNSKQVIKIVSIKDIDPLLVQQAIDSISGRSTAMQQRRPGDPGSGITPGSFAPGAFGTPGRGFGSGGFQGGGFQGGFPAVIPGAFPTGGTGGPVFRPGGGGGGPGGGKGGGFGPKGGASLDRGSDFFVSRVMDDPPVNVLYGGFGPTGGASPNRGSDFFVSRVMDDPPVNVLYDPSEEQDEPIVVPYPERYLKSPSYTANPLHFTSLEQEPVPPPKEMKGKDSKDDVFAPRLGVQVEVLPDLGVIILRANSPADLAAILQIIELIRVYSQPALIDVKLVPVRLGDPVQIVNVLNQLYGRVIIGPYDTKIRAATGAPALGQPQPVAQPGAIPGAQPAQPQLGAAAQPTNIVLLAQPRLSAILVAASRARMPDIVNQIQLLDQRPSDPHHAKIFPLKRAAAAQVAASLTTFYATRFPAPDNINQIRITSDIGSNSVIVQASPADLTEIDRLIHHIDETASKYHSEIRVVPLRLAVASDLATLLQLSIANGVLAVTQAAGGAPGQVPGAIPGAAGQQAVTTKDGTLRIIPSRSKDGKPFETRILEDIRVNADIRTNSLVISAPAESMPLVLALVNELDVLPAAKSEIAIFQLKKSDATQLALMLQQFFTGSAVTGAKTGAPTPGLPGPAGVPGGTATRPPITFTINGTSDVGAPIIDLRLTIDERTNSLIVAGGKNDLRVVETIIARIEDADVPQRRSEAIRLRNSQAADVANAISTFLTNYQNLYIKYNQGTNFLELQREVVVVAEPISNSLIVNATPQYFDMIVNLIAKLDTSVPQVVIQVLIAEVTMNGSEEFGMEIGLQNPLSFMRGLIPGGTAVTYAAVAGGGPGSPGTTTAANQPFGNPGYFFNNPNIPIPNNTGFSPRQLGIQSLTNVGVGRVSSASGLGGYTFSANADVVSVLIRALKIQSRLNVLSRPQLTTLDNQTAVIQAVTYFPIVSGASTITTGVVTAPPITHVPLGVTMQVTPRITPDGRVIMRVIPEVSAIDSTTFPLGNGTFGTSYKTQHLETTVSASDGETVLLGGLITKVDNKNENKVPWLGDLPGIGAAFRYRTYDNKKTELIIIMTPHIVRNPQERERILAEESRRIDWNLGDVMRMHGSGNSLPCLPAVMQETQSKIRPFRIYPGAPAPAQALPRPGALPEYTPAAGQPGPQTNIGPTGTRSSVPVVTDRGVLESTADLLNSGMLPPAGTTVRYLPPVPAPPLPAEVIMPRGQTPPAPLLIGPN